MFKREAAVFDFGKMDNLTRGYVFSLLPDTAKEISSVIGLDKTMALVNEFRGQNIRFGSGKSERGRQPFEEVVLLVGIESALKLHEHWPNDDVYIPLCSNAIRYLRNKAISSEFDEMTRTTSSRKAINFLAKKYEMSYRAIEKHVLKTAYPQGENQP